MEDVHYSLYINDCLYAIGETYNTVDCPACPKTSAIYRKAVNTMSIPCRHLLIEELRELKLNRKCPNCVTVREALAIYRKKITN